MAYKKRPTTNPILPARKEKRSKNGFRNIRKVIIISTFVAGQRMFLSFPRKDKKKRNKPNKKGITWLFVFSWKRTHKWTKAFGQI